MRGERGEERGEGEGGRGEGEGKERRERERQREEKGYISTHYCLSKKVVSLNVPNEM